MSCKPMESAQQGGYYCSDCGTCHATLPDGIVTCRMCGHLGLRGYWNIMLIGLACGFSGCEWRGWDDGGVNDDAGEHLREAHPEALLTARFVSRKSWAVFDAEGMKVWPEAPNGWSRRSRACEMAQRLNVRAVMRSRP